MLQDVFFIFFLLLAYSKEKTEKDTRTEKRVTETKTKL